MAGWRIFAPGWGAGAAALVGLAVASMLGLQEAGDPRTVLPAAIFGAMATVKGMVNTKAKTRRPQLQRVLDRLTGLVRRDSTGPERLSEAEETAE